MPSSTHEGVVQLIQQRPELAANLLGDLLGVGLPAFKVARAEPADLPTMRPTTNLADAVVTLFNADATDPLLAVVVEVQLRRDHRKHWSWPVYLANLRARHECPVMLLVICTDRATATWCSTPIELGHPGWDLQPIVLGPNQVPLVTDVEQARDLPELAILSAALHAYQPDVHQILSTLNDMLTTRPLDTAVRYAELTFALLPEVIRPLWEEMMSTQTSEFRSEYANRFVAEGRAEGLAEGLAEGEARLVVMVLEARGITVPGEVYNRINDCTDTDQLEEWGRRAAVIQTIDELFG